MTETLKIQLALSGLQSVQSGIQSLGATVQRAMTAIPATMAAIGAVTAVAVRELVQVNASIAKIANEAERFGVSTEFLSSFQYALRLTGVEQSKLGEAMKGYVEKAQSQGRAVGDLSAELMRQADVFSRMPDGPRKTALATSLFGEAGIALIPVLNQGGDGLREMADEAKRFGIVIGQDAAKGAKELTADLQRMSAVFEGLKLKVAGDVTPAFSELGKVGLALASLRNPADGTGNWLKQAADDVASAVSGITRDYLEIKGFLDTYVPTLLTTGSHQAALNQGLEDSDKLLKEYDSNLRRLKEPLKDVAKDTEALVAGMHGLARERALAMANLSVADTENAGRMVPDRDRRDRSREIAQQRLAELQSQIRTLEAESQSFLYEYASDPSGGGQAGTERSLQAREKRIALLKEEAQAQAELNRLGASESRMVWTNTFLDLQNQWGSLSAQLAGTFASTFNTGISSISSNLTGLIMQTRTWAQALANIGTTILSTVIQSIIEMGVRWVLTRATVGIANILWSQKEAVAAAPKAMMESISSYGVAALVGGAAFAGIMAAVGGFESGGYTGNIGTSTPAGIVHGREFVMSAPATAAIGVDTLNAMNESGGIPASGGQEIRVIVVDNARDAQDLQRDPNFRNVVVNIAKEEAWRVRG